MPSRETIAVNTKRQLWADCAGYCQNPWCNKYLFVNIDDDVVSIANLAHIIGAGKTGPRTEQELEDHIEKNGYSNLIMLCLECHKIVDELEAKFGVETLRKWKAEHSNKVAALFNVPTFTTKRELFVHVDRLLEENETIFLNNGPFSPLALSGPGGDSQRIWRRRCLDTILPNNERIVRIFRKHLDNFGFSRAIYTGFLDFEVHADSFKENCLFEEKINDYKTFPMTFPNRIKRALGVKISEDPRLEQQEIEYRQNEVRTILAKFLAEHQSIRSTEYVNLGVFVVERRNGVRLRVFVTHNYVFTEYTYDKVLSQDPNILAIICSNPYATYTQSAKERCLSDGVGLFKLGEFMGAINFDDDRFLNYLSKDERNSRISKYRKAIQRLDFLQGCDVYLYGSFLRTSFFNDIDLLLVYPDGRSVAEVDSLLSQMKTRLARTDCSMHIEACSKSELPQFNFNFDNRVKLN